MQRVLLLLGMIKFYQRLLSPLFPSCCRFYPSCSQYAVKALQAHGVLYGCVLIAWRLLRCQPLARGGLDPVPEARQDQLQARPKACRL